ncbi:hypothetical protein pEaSNUABM50_00411 [Erwinia phage pEa_SNUABM_50]|uniref:Uncharacterized protein n=4 Tax=Eneladusvirus BF TaxID=2560751 RepID=A0A7L8ZPM2_9CAUD|nr:hypothetical protein FDH34_gp510 [Serratia phage BF]QOI71349.1 hypothetical protein pEaSNUABM12_00417 [Erwinia phage pEa_SNUABM_12]QOI71891.1 hypothetical protein pEaSNUABM47_00413 [Erwinia phage pEa_SNUABM_47]QOI72430.1 hypothetical protein pEaSNUABM50_00411 [Erwinia phage pEa_SNUABM_50]QXO11557.1 hypothetical protein pEaSNUABM19_00417 [Erwinia phage pEa_SNUABM_19]QXO12105.1 hypothetical protein pEaSNUABM44_00415 [Erwinia phage pEa_SNUABM_44]QXO12658.1 hypothetical protein pEaSNUABM49_004
MEEQTFPEEIFKALEDIYVKYIIPNGKVDKFLSWADLEDRDLTDCGFELHPDYENKYENSHHICLYGTIGTTYISDNNLTFFYHGGGQPPSVLDNYTELTEERHFQLGTTTFLAGVFELQDFQKIHNYFNKIM